MREAIEILLYAVGAYLGVGVVFGVLFAFRGALAIDDVARHAPLRFRLLILPGAAALWPVLAMKWRRAARSLGSTHGAHP